MIDPNMNHHGCGVFVTTEEVRVLSSEALCALFEERAQQAYLSFVEVVDELRAAVSDMDRRRTEAPKKGEARQA